jgi:hypothetical protein
VVLYIKKGLKGPVSQDFSVLHNQSCQMSPDSLSKLLSNFVSNYRKHLNSKDVHRQRVPHSAPAVQSIACMVLRQFPLYSRSIL